MTSKLTCVVMTINLNMFVAYNLQSINLKIRSKTVLMYKRLRSNGGLKGLYSGCVGGMVGTALADAVYFGVYEPMKVSVKLFFWAWHIMANH